MMNANTRYPAVAGMFYDSERARLEAQLKGFFSRVYSKRDSGENIIGLVAPHAGYEYSGFVAAHAYATLGKSSPKNFIIIGLNHTGFGPPVSVRKGGGWLTPLGEAKTNENMANEIISNSAATADESAHLREHSIEVQLPFLQFLYGNDFSFVPVCMKEQSFDAAKGLAEAILKIKEKFVVIASSDFTHFESRESAERKDAAAIRAIESLDAKGFYETVERERISVCGFGPIAALMIITKELGGKILLIKRSTSGNATGDYDSVVGYAALKAVRK